MRHCKLYPHTISKPSIAKLQSHDLAFKIKLMLQIYSNDMWESNFKTFKNIFDKKYTVFLKFPYF